MLRVDREKTDAISKDIEDDIIGNVKALIPDVDVVILSDYKKGLLTKTLVSEIIKIAKLENKPVVVDPKGADFSLYKGATVITPNRKELETAIGSKVETDDQVKAAALKLIKDFDFEAILATRSEAGLSLVSKDGTVVNIPAYVREVYDVSGAGDSVIASFATSIATGASFKDAALISNVAGGVAVGKTGTATVSPDEIKKIVEEDVIKEKITFSLNKTKLATRKKATEHAERLKVKGLKVGFTNGCFDLLHPGHLSTLRQAKEACDFLIVGVNSDISVQMLKGPTRPVQKEDARVAILSALEMVDMVVVFEEESVLETIKAIKPDVIVKGGQYKLEEVVGYDFVMAYGGKIVRAEMEEGFSTTNTIKKASA